VGRALAHGGFLNGLSNFTKKPLAFRRAYNDSRKAGVNELRLKQKRRQTGVYDRECHQYLETHDCFDRLAQKLMLDYAPSPSLVYPFATGVHVQICQGLHETGGLPGNWAIDFCCDPGTWILVPELATVTRFSGHSPGDDQADSMGVFGWTTYLLSPRGYQYFITHQGSRLASLRVGMIVRPGDQLGRVGDQRFRPDHAHIGVTSPLGPTDAKRRMTAVSQAARIH
jgi:hypothetical protein